MEVFASVELLDRLLFAGNLLRGLELAIAGLEDVDAMNGLTAVLVAAQSALSEATGSVQRVSRLEAELAELAT